jgi:DNA-binding transcriptional LysR family regulator
MLGLSQLRAFEAITRTGSFARAAERLHVTPPAVSLQVRQLEREYGVRLFERVGRHVRLTPAGEALRPYAQRLFALAEDAERVLQGTADFGGSRLRIAATPTMAGYYLAPFWKALRARYPKLELELSVHNSRAVKERLLALEDDLGMLAGEADHPDIVLEPFARNELVVIVSPAHPWARRSWIALEALRDQPLILREPGSEGRALVERELRRADIPLHTVVEVASTEAVKQAVEAGGGVGLLATAVVRRDVAGGYLRALRVRGGDFTLTLSLAYHRERQGSPLIRGVVEAVRATARPGCGTPASPAPRRGAGSASTSRARSRAGSGAAATSSPSSRRARGASR